MHHLLKPNNFAMKEWHAEHIEKVIVKFARGLSPDASAFEKRSYKKYGTITHCTRQIEYDMKHGVEHTEVMEIFRKIRLDKMYKELQSNAEATARLRELEDLFSGAQKIAEEDRFRWHRNAFSR
jgi:hypothetical protein